MSELEMIQVVLSLSGRIESLATLAGTRRESALPPPQLTVVTGMIDDLERLRVSYARRLPFPE